MNATRIDRGSTETTTIYSEGADLTFERTFDAPRELVWKAWTEDMDKWSAPPQFTMPVSEGDLRPGGKWRACMKNKKDGLYQPQPDKLSKVRRKPRKKKGLGEIFADTPLFGQLKDLHVQLASPSVVTQHVGDADLY